jgi:hypothetical protein
MKQCNRRIEVCEPSDGRLRRHCFAIETERLIYALLLALKQPPLHDPPDHGMQVICPRLPVPSNQAAVVQVRETGVECLGGGERPLRRVIGRVGA